MYEIIKESNWFEQNLKVNIYQFKIEKEFNKENVSNIRQSAEFKNDEIKDFMPDKDK